MSYIRSPVRRVDAQIGLHYDWLYAGSPVIAREVVTIQNGSQQQPINQVNIRVNGKYPPGGDWFAFKRRYLIALVGDEVEAYRIGWNIAYKGYFYLTALSASQIPSNDSLYGGSFKESLFSKLESYGAEGYAKARPAQPDFSLATTLLEMKDFPGMFRQSIHLCINRILTKNPNLYYDFGRNGFFRIKDKTRLSHTAEWYLSLNFGWLPIIKGVQDYIVAQRKGQESLKQLLRDEGRPIIRRRTIKEEVRKFVFSNLNSTVSNPPYNVMPQFVTQCYDTDVSVPYEDVYSVKSKIEFVAKFVYWLPEGPRDVAWTARMLRRLLGSRVTPSVAWNLMPWTFLIDYYSTLGKAIENLGPGVEQQLYTEYCYVTFKEDITRNTSTQVVTFDAARKRVSSVVQSVEISSLRSRVSADPFAFRFTGLDVSVKQTAILAALALK